MTLRFDTVTFRLDDMTFTLDAMILEIDVMALRFNFRADAMTLRLGYMTFRINDMTLRLDASLRGLGDLGGEISIACFSKMVWQEPGKKRSAREVLFVGLAHGRIGRV